MHSGEMIIGDIPVNIQRKNSLKNMYIRVNPPEGSVVVSAPIDLTDDEIRLFVLRKIPEVKKVRDRMLAQERQTKREYVSGESHYLWGKPYRLQVIYEGNSRKILKTPTKIIMTVPEGTPVEMICSRRAGSTSTLPSSATSIPQPMSTPTRLGVNLSFTSIVVPMVHPIPAWESGMMRIFASL